MKKSFIDTNIFVEIFVRKGPKSDKSFDLLDRDDNLCTTSLVVSEMEWVMRAGYGIEKQNIIKAIKKILTSNIEIDNKKLLLDVLHYFELKNVDWTDCLNMFLMKKEGITDVYSYDRGLNKFDWIKRLEP